MKPFYGVIGRIYRSETLPQLVSFMLTSYLKQPADYLMQYFDMVQLGDDFSLSSKQFRRDPALVAHAGNVSTRDSVEKMEQMMLNRRFEPYKENNPRCVRQGSVLEQGQRVQIEFKHFDARQTDKPN
jgi:hypothetical protein